MLIPARYALRVASLRFSARLASLLLTRPAPLGRLAFSLYDLGPALDLLRTVMDEFAHAKSQLWVTRLNCYIEHLVVKHVLRVYPNIQTDSEISSLLHILSIYLNIPYLLG